MTQSIGKCWRILYLQVSSYNDRIAAIENSIKSEIDAVDAKQQVWTFEFWGATSFFSFTQWFWTQASKSHLTVLEKEMVEALRSGSIKWSFGHRQQNSFPAPCLCLMLAVSSRDLCLTVERRCPNRSGSAVLRCRKHSYRAAAYFIIPG